MIKVLVTGANGFAGQHVVKELAGDYQVIGFCGLDDPRPQNAPNVEYVTVDITSKQINALLEKHRPDMIIHLAAMTTSWFANPRKVIEVNITGTANLYESVIKVGQNKPYRPKIIYVSTSEIYGKTPAAGLITENSSFYPTNHYSATKLGADRLSYDYSQSQNLNIVIARPFTHTGSGQKKGFFVPDMASQIAAIEKDPSVDSVIKVGNLESVRDYLDVRDVAVAYRMLLETDVTPGEAFNICTGRGQTMKDILNTLIKMSKREIGIEQDPARLRPSDVPIFVGDNSKFVDLTGWHPTFSIEDTLQSALDDWRSRS